MVNEFSGRNYSCGQYVPAGAAYAASVGHEIICAPVGAKPGLSFVNEDDYINSAFEYKHENKGR
jgi:ATP-binding cassette, subfamily G (WHITE), member 2, PDR